MVKNLRKYLWIGAFAVTTIGIPAAAQQYPTPEQRPQDRQDQIRHDQDDQNPQVNQDEDRVRRDQDVNRPQDQDQMRRDRDDQNRNRAGDLDRDNVNQQWVNTKAYRQGLKDGEHDRSKNRGERADRRHWKNDQDRQAYEAGYNSGYRGNSMPNNDRDRDRR